MTAFALRRNLKIFILSALAGGICSGVATSLQYGLRTGALTGLCTGVLYGTVMYFILGVLHTKAVKHIAGAVNEETIGTFHSRELALDQSFERAFDLCLASLRQLGRFRILDEDRLRGRIAARLPLNWKTWGDIVRFDLVREEMTKTRITLSSRPSSRMTIVDYGRNLANVNAIVSILKATEPPS